MFCLVFISIVICLCLISVFREENKEKGKILFFFALIFYFLDFLRRFC